VELAIATRIPISEWESRPWEDILTALDVLQKQAERMK